MIADDIRTVHPVRPGSRVIFTAEPTESIVSVVDFRGRILIATTSRLLEWEPDTDTIKVLELVAKYAD